MMDFPRISHSYNDLFSITKVLKNNMAILLLLELI